MHKTIRPDTLKPRADKFLDLAHELEADEDEAAFEETVTKTVQAPHEAAKPKAE